MNLESEKRAVTVERRSDREFAITRTFDAPAALVFDAWSRPELFRQWWTPKSFGMTILSCKMDVRTGGSYRIEIGHPASEVPMAFFGRYLEVVPGKLMVWTNDENGEGPVTRVTFAEENGRTIVVYSNTFATAQAMEDELASGACDGMGEAFAQLEAVLAA